MAVQVSTVSVYAGDSLRMEYHLLVAAETPSDLSGWDFTASFRKRATSAVAIELTVDTTDAATGVLVITATPEQTAAMGGSGVWDLQGVDGDTVHTFLRGTLLWEADVTRV